MGFLIGIVVGAIAGYAAGLLSSPKTGQENRDLIGDRVPELRARAPEVADAVLKEAKSRLDGGREAFREGVTEAREALTRQLERAQRGESSSEGTPPAA